MRKLIISIPCILVMLWTALSWAQEPYQLEYKGELQNQSSEINQALFGEQLKKQQLQISNGDTDKIYDIIESDLWGEFRNIAKVLTGEVESYQNNFNLGLVNTQGFEWQKPYGFFKIYTKREIKKDLRNSIEKWIANDTFVLEVDAESFLKKMAKSKLIEITEATLEASASLKFQKVFQYTHEYGSQEEALNSDFQKLFFPFLFSRKYEDLRENDKLSVYDTLSLKAGIDGLVTWGPYLSLSLGSSYYFNLLKTTILEKESAYLYRLEKIKTTNQAFQLDASLQAGLLKLINLTLFNYSYKYSKQKELKKIYHIDLENMKDLGQATSDLIQNKDLSESKVGPFDRFLSYESNSQKKEGLSRFGFLMWKGNRSKSSESIVISPDGVRKDIFHKESLYLSKSKTTLWGFLKGSVLDAILGLSFNMNTIKAESSRIEIEYEHDNKRNLSINIYRDFYHRLKTKKEYKSANEMLEKQTSIAENLQNAPLKNKINFRQEISLNAKHINQLIRKSKLQIQQKINLYCDKVPQKRKIKKCKRKLSRHFKKIREHYLETLSYHTESLKTFLKYFVKYNQDYSDLEKFWSPSNTRLQGELETQLDQTPFRTYFHSGSYSGITVLDRYYKSLESK